MLSKLALAGFPIFTYDDSRNNRNPPANLGESQASSHGGTD